MQFKCPKCGSTIDEGVNTCPTCGQQFNWPEKENSAPKEEPASESVIESSNEVTADNSKDISPDNVVSETVSLTIKKEYLIAICVFIIILFLILTISLISEKNTNKRYRHMLSTTTTTTEITTEEDTTETTTEEETTTEDSTVKLTTTTTVATTEKLPTANVILESSFPMTIVDDYGTVTINSFEITNVSYVKHLKNFEVKVAYTTTCVEGMTVGIKIEIFDSDGYRIAIRNEWTNDEVGVPTKYSDSFSFSESGNGTYYMKISLQ